MKFTYFEDPRSYAFLADKGVQCEFCSTSEDCLDGGSLSGEEDIEAVCFQCMRNGKLVDLEISANEIFEDQLSGDKDNLSNIITYMTPSIPAWQDISWPVKNGVPYKFIKIAYWLAGNKVAHPAAGIADNHDVGIFFQLRLRSADRLGMRALKGLIAVHKHRFL